MTRNVTVFGGTGFFGGRRVVRHLREGGFTVWIASRHPARGRELFIEMYRCRERRWA